MENKFKKHTILTVDFLAEPVEALYWHADRILSLLKVTLSCIGLEAKIYPTDFTSKISRFNRDIFFMKSGMSYNESYSRLVDFEEITKESLDYFDNFFDVNNVIIGWELQKLTTDILNAKGITYINICLHPIRYMEDEIFLIQSNNKNLEKKLKHYEIDESSFYINAEFVRISLLNKKKVYDLPPESCVIFGQTNNDKTLRTNNKRLTLQHYKKDIDFLCQKFRNIYFIAHPLEKNNTQINQYIQSFGKINMIEANAYSVLSSKNLSLVAAISSSVCSEAYYFNKNVLFFNKPVCDIKTSDSYSVDKIIFSPQFWNNLFNLEVKNITNKKFIFNKNNQVRDILNAYYSYTILEQR